jgi:hypothetical protein
MLILGLAALILPFFLKPSPALVGTHTQLFLPPCLLYRLTGVPCPTCGMTTSFALVAHGRIYQAFFAHPLGALAYLCLAALTLLMAVAAIGRRAVTAAMVATPVQILIAIGVCWTAKLSVWFLLAR